MNRPVQFVTTVCIAAQLAMPFAQADILTLNSGEIMQGKIISQNDYSVRMAVGNEILFYPSTQVRSIAFTSPAPVAPTAPIAPAVAPMVTPPLVTPVAAIPAPVATPSQQLILPAGTPLLVKMGQTLITGTDGVGEQFACTLESNLKVNGVKAVPMNSPVYGVITLSDQAHGLFGKSKMKLTLNTLLVNGTANPIITDQLQIEGNGNGKRSLTRIGAGAGIGAAVGGGKGAIIGTVVGTALGFLMGGSATGVTTGDILEFHLEQPLTVQGAN